ncbi:hypothetical protein Gotur_010511 [Gossypium turneri]
MEKGFLDMVENNAAVRAWSEMTHHEKGDSLAEGYVSKLWDFTCISVTQNSLQELKKIWDQWNNKVDKHLFWALAQFWNPAYSCFTFEKVDLVLTVEEYMALLQCSKIQVDRVYSRAVNVPTFLKKLINITGMSEQWVATRIKQKGDSKCIPWKNLKDVILAQPDTKKRVDVFALIMYGLVVFPKALGHVDEAVTDLFDRLDRGVTLVPAILVETFSYFWRDDISEEKWMAILQNLREEDVEWRAPWLLSDEILYRCGDFDWVPLLGIWEAVGYAPLLVLRQYRSRQFIPATHGLAEFEFSYKGDGY